MADNRRIINIYKQGQGAWARFTLAAVVMALVLWMLAAVNGTFSQERTLLSKDETAIKATSNKAGDMTRELKREDIENLPENVLSILVIIEGKTTAKSPSEILKAIDDNTKVVLASTITYPRVITEKRLEKLKANLSDRKIDVIEKKEWVDSGETKNLTFEELEKKFDDGSKMELSAEVLVDTWWYSPVLTVPGIDVPFRWGALVVATLFLACAFGVYKLLNRPRLADFLIESESELKRVDWPSKVEVVASTKVVVVVVVLMTLILFFLDLINATLIKDGLFKIFLPKN